MRYRDTGEVHRDFHLALDRTLDYIVPRYGEPFLEELCRRTAQEVYRDIYNHLRLGDPEPLLEHLVWYTEREGGTYRIEREATPEGWAGTSDETGGDDSVKAAEPGEIRFVMEHCPMIGRIREKNGSLSPFLELFLRHLYQSWGEMTPFALSLEMHVPPLGYTIRIGRSHAAQ